MNYHEPFAAFCNRIAAPIKVHIADGNYTLPEEYNDYAPKLMKILRDKKDSFPYFAITFIQSEFDNMNNVVEILKQKTKDGEIPDALLVYYAYNIYSKFDENGIPGEGEEVCYNDLQTPQQNIIKVVSVYTMLHS